ncbi:RNA polymerase III transcription factor TFIIIC subunit Tfc4 [Aspergillus heteromorphus CBS 117.55]|uniref:RNA polymerase III transcription factor TFIIIC subunit Tfc4 n=1 Tax=Aspergillus heteromorphus CBS 117.55 TaxID=1448321 RepID=A0A317WBV2_9EURO|nr:RNA polymerase III transcription factor TFIIIC subunit Tfc4 [Aspergillus heteromorphus CBS 117.55]PWY82837.1 RNA polymerase III transcription factor TFIIIC subunit Tfc4 [Aspergillus heteromorphus CBS 117.55]
MDYPDDHHTDHGPPPEEFAYPDIDETIHYPWQGAPPAAQGQGESSLHSVLDPRLYKDLFAGSASQEPERSSVDKEAEEYAEADDSDQSLYTLSSSEESSSEEEPEPEDGEDDDDYSRRRHRRGTGPFSGRYGARGGKGIKRGPRKPLEPSPEFKMLHSEATSAFIDGDYDRAIDLTKRAIQINPEMFAAHSLLSEIFLAQGEKDKALTALFSGAHTRPKDPTVWAKVARMILERAGDDRQSALNDVIYCYSRVLDVDPKNYNARFQRTAIYRELGYNGRAATEYERILREVPHNTRALRHLAETYIDLNDVGKAVVQWANSVEYFQSLEPEDVPDFSWSDVNIYTELYSYLDQHFQGLVALKSVSRWLLGRRSDTMWEDFHEDDREWDADDSPRRIKTDGFDPRTWSRDYYGLGLPLELRIKLGLFRLKMGYDHKEEALHHFEWLNPDDTSENARLYDYGDLFREVADALKDVGLYEDALRFYLPIQQTNEYADASFFMALGDCFKMLDKIEDAENCFLTVAEHDTKHVESRVQLAKLYESIGMSEQALKYVNEAVLLGRQETRSNRRRKDTRLEQLAMEFRTADVACGETVLRPIAPKPSTDAPAPVLTSAPLDKRDAVMDEGQRSDNVRYLYAKLLQLQPQMKEGNAEAMEDWLDIADALLREFRSNRVFYPLQRNMTFLGYSREAQRKVGKSKGRHFIDEMQEMAGRIQESLGNIPEEPLQGTIPTDYYGIRFEEWLDMFLQYALTVAAQGESDEAYDTLAAAADASVWYHSKPDARMIHVCWFTCALRMQDEETLANEARWFIKEYQFVTDTYRLFSMLSRLSGDPRRSLFHSSPNMKFMLRQIKAIDFTLPDNHTGARPSKLVRESVYKERASLSTRDEVTGEAIPADEMDVALLVLYGHILYSGNSFYPALNYLFRAYALDDQNPAVLLSIALCYIHHSFKRQSENRHYLIMQGLSFMHEYRRVRERPGTLLAEQQEMEFNFARVWHSLGIAHLAKEGYHRVLQLGEQIQAQSQPQSADGSDVIMTDDDDAADAPVLFVEDFSREAAVALQIIYAVNGDYQSAHRVTSKWLVI